MTCPPPLIFAHEVLLTQTQIPKAPTTPRIDRRKPAPSAAPGPLERLAELMLSNEHLMDELATSRLRISEARSYLDSPRGNIRFGEAHLDRCRTRHSGILAQLRANRIEALQLLGEGGSGV